MKNSTKYKVGDWLFHEFELSQVKECRSNNCMEVSTGYFSTSGQDLSDKCRPLSLRNAVISDCFNSMSRKIHAEANRSCNFPDIHWKLVLLWVSACDSASDDSLQKIYKDAEAFVDGVLSVSKRLQSESVSGVRLFR